MRTTFHRRKQPLEAARRVASNDACRLPCVYLLVVFLVLTGCASQQTPSPSPTPPPTATPSATPTLTSSPTVTPTPTLTPSPTASPIPTETPPPPPTDTPTPLPTDTPPPPPTETPPPPTATPALPAWSPAPPPGRAFATLDDFWAGAAEWVLEISDTGLPIGESDTVYRGNGEFWSYLHASYESAGVVDQCGDPAPFPGCVTLWRSTDGGQRFSLESPTCLFRCQTCPCTAADHTHQQQYPRVFFDTDRVYVVYEWGAGSYMRTSSDGIHWGREAHVPGTGQWNAETCPVAASIGDHPNIWAETEYGNCLVGAPPGIYVEGNLLYVFVGLGRNPGHMGCLVGNKVNGAGGLSYCASNPLFGAVNGYGPLDALGPAANAYFDFRTISSADVVRWGDRYYMVYEGIRGPSDPAVVDDQFAIGIVRSTGPALDGTWETYPSNPILMDLPGNVGVGHGDLVIVGPATYLYSTTTAGTRGRYVLVYR